MEFRRRRCCCPVARVTGVLLLSVLVFRGVCSAGEEWNMTLSVPRSVKCPVGRDCILNCTFKYRAGGGGGGGLDERSAVRWTRQDLLRNVHGYYNNEDMLSYQHRQYKVRTCLFVSEIPCGNASLLLRRVTEGDAGIYECLAYSPERHGSGLTKLVPVLPS
ncbi:UNVERIFIED_CONTAM: hypothetical protein FKN15_061950 [Acipenser sinensis]